MKRPVIGWDIGGAHVKAVMLDEAGCVVQAAQLSCALWQGMSLLVKALQQVLSTWQVDAKAYTHAVTMTGELVDLFSHRAQGVTEIANCMQQQLGNCFFYAANAESTEFVRQVTGLSSMIASMNWHASALCLAKQQPTTMLVIDIGSTTTDVTRCDHGQVFAEAWTDAERMTHGQLFYSGVVRTPLMAFGPYLQWRQRPQHLAAEYFATTADVYRLTGDLNVDDDLVPTADGQDKSEHSTMRRLARMVGHDIEDLPNHAWLALAQAFKQQQITMIVQLISPYLTSSTVTPSVIGLGAGQWLVAQIAATLGLRYQSAQSTILAENPQLQRQAAVAFPAYAVARLWQQWH